MTNQVLHEINLRRLEHEYQSVRQRIEFSQVLASGGLKVVILINGGALIALFTLLGNLNAESKFAISENYLMIGLGLFVFGLVAACVAHLFVYFAQESLVEATGAECGATYEALRDNKDRVLGAGDSPHAKGRRWAWAAIACFGLSLGAFCVGSSVSFLANQKARDEANNRALIELVATLQEKAQATRKDVERPAPSSPSS